MGIIVTAWCSEIGSLTSLDAPELHAASDVTEPSDVREPSSLLQAVVVGSDHEFFPQSNQIPARMQHGEGSTINSRNLEHFVELSH